MRATSSRTSRRRLREAPADVDRPHSPQIGPYPVMVEEGRTYRWCSAGSARTSPGATTPTRAPASSRSSSSRPSRPSSHVRLQGLRQQALLLRQPAPATPPWRRARDARIESRLRMSDGDTVFEVIVRQNSVQAHPQGAAHTGHALPRIEPRGHLRARPQPSAPRLHRRLLPVRRTRTRPKLRGTCAGFRQTLAGEAHRADRSARHGSRVHGSRAPRRHGGSERGTCAAPASAAGLAVSNRASWSAPTA